MNSVEKATVLHCLKSMIDEALCEECSLYGTTGTDHCEKDCIRLAINELEREPQEYCDRNLCLKNEYKGIGCDECEVTKSQEPQERSDKK